MHSLTVCLLDMTLVSFPNPQQDHPGNQTNIAYARSIPLYSSIYPIKCLQSDAMFYTKKLRRNSIEPHTIVKMNEQSMSRTMCVHAADALCLGLGLLCYCIP